MIVSKSKKLETGTRTVGLSNIADKKKHVYFT